LVHDQPQVSEGLQDAGKGCNWFDDDRCQVGLHHSTID
jgi:hypothetical protein